MSWAVPGQDSDQILDSKSHLCDRYIINKTISNITCAKDLFTSQIETCSEWVFDSNERTIVNDVCDAIF